jgi:hypothetical protein
MFVVRRTAGQSSRATFAEPAGDAGLLASGSEHLPVLVVQAKDFQLKCGQFQG